MRVRVWGQGAGAGRASRELCASRGCVWAFEARGVPFWGLVAAPLVGTTRTPLEPTCRGLGYMRITTHPPNHPSNHPTNHPTHPTTQPQVEHFSRYAVPMDSDDDDEEGGRQELDEGGMQVEGSGSGEWGTGV